MKKNPFLLSPREEISKVNKQAAQRSLRAIAGTRYLPHNIHARASYLYDRDVARKRLKDKMMDASIRMGPRTLTKEERQSLQNRALPIEKFEYLLRQTLSIRLQDDELCELALSFAGKEQPNETSTVNGENFYLALLKMAKEAKHQRHEKNVKSNTYQQHRTAAPARNAARALIQQKLTNSISYAFSASEKAKVWELFAAAEMRSGWDKRYGNGSKRGFETAHLTPTELKEQCKICLNIDLKAKELGALVVILLEEEERIGVKQSKICSDASTNVIALRASREITETRALKSHVDDTDRDGLDTQDEKNNNEIADDSSVQQRINALTEHPVLAASVARGGRRGVLVSGHAMQRFMRRAGRAEGCRLRKVLRKQIMIRSLREEIVKSTEGAKTSFPGLSSISERTQLGSAISKLMIAARNLGMTREPLESSGLVQGQLSFTKFRELLCASLGCTLTSLETSALANHLKERRYSAIAMSTSVTMNSGKVDEAQQNVIDGSDFIAFLSNLKVRCGNQGSRNIGIGVGAAMTGGNTWHEDMVCPGVSKGAAQYGRLRAGGGSTITIVRRNAVEAATGNCKAEPSARF